MRKKEARDKLREQEGEAAHDERVRFDRYGVAVETGHDVHPDDISEPEW